MALHVLGILDPSSGIYLSFFLNQMDFSCLSLVMGGGIIGRIAIRCLKFEFAFLNSFELQIRHWFSFLKLILYKLLSFFIFMQQLMALLYHGVAQ